MNEEINRVYKDVGRAGAFSSAGELYTAIRRRGIKVKRKDVDEFVKSQLSNTMFQRRKRKQVVTFSPTLDNKWQLDLGFYPIYKGFQAFLVWYALQERKSKGYPSVFQCGRAFSQVPSGSFEG